LSLHGEEVPDMGGEDWDANFITQLVDCDEGDEDGDADMDVDEEPVSKYDRFSQELGKWWIFQRS
jgi:hypothetical protein